MILLFFVCCSIFAWIASALFVLTRSTKVRSRAVECASLIARGSMKKAWKPFVRMDNMRSPLPTMTSLVSRSFLIAPLKLWGTLALLAISASSALLLNRSGVAAVGRWVSRSILSTLGIHVVQIGKRAPSNVAPLLISNHVAAMDILALLSLGGCFVAKEAVKHLPGIGRVAASIGCIFVGRDSADSRSAAKESIAAMLKAKMTNASCTQNPLVIFPEGTTTNGFGLIEFRRGGFEAGVPIQPVRLDYSNLQYSMAMLDALEHLCYMCVLPGCTLQVNYLPVINPEPGQTVELVAKRCRDALLKGTKLESYGLETHRDEVDLISFIERDISTVGKGTLHMKKST